MELFRKEDQLVEKLYFLSFALLFQESLIHDKQGHAFYLLLDWLTDYPDVLNKKKQPYVITETLAKDLKARRHDVPEPFKKVVQKNTQVSIDAVGHFEKLIKDEISPLKDALFYHRLWKLIDASEIPPELRADWLAEYNAHEYGRFLADVFLFAIVQDAPLLPPPKKKKDPGKGNASRILDDIEKVNDMLKKLPKLEPIRMPNEIAQVENPFVSELFRAYGDYKGVIFHEAADLPEDLQRDLANRRKDFYDAETVLVQGCDILCDIDKTGFRELKEEVLSNVRDVYEEAQEEDGYHRMRKVMSQAVLVPCVKSVLGRTCWVGAGERRGVCHMLAGEQILRWVTRDE